MSAQQPDLQQAVDAFRRHVQADVDEDEGPVGEYKAAEYIVFALALGVYCRHLAETIRYRMTYYEGQMAAIDEALREDTALTAEQRTSLEETRAEAQEKFTRFETFAKKPVDEVASKGIALLRRLDAKVEAIQGFIDGHLGDESHKQLLARAFKRRARSVKGVGRRAKNLGIVLNRGGPKTVKGIFGTAQARRQIKQGLAAATLSDGDAALDIFASMPASVIQNALIRKWLKLAAATAKPLTAMLWEVEEGEAVTVVAPTANPVERAATEMVEQAPQLLAQQAQQEGTMGGEDIQESQQARQKVLDEVEQSATAAARETLEKNEELDEPPTRSEVVGIATAAVTAALSDPDNPHNIPETLRDLDEEQRAAALTDGKVLVAAGAGAGKSTTLVARVSHLVKDRGVDPSRVMVTSFNRKAALELEDDIAGAIGSDRAKTMSVGTMNSLFNQNIMKHGSPEEREAMSGPLGPKEVGRVVTRTVQRMWEECFDKETNPKPAVKSIKTIVSQWVGNDVSVADAKEIARSKKERTAALWYEMYEGLKGNLSGWEPPCEDRAREVSEAEYQEKLRKYEEGITRYRPKERFGTTYERFMKEHRTVDEGKDERGRPIQRTVRLGDFSDQINIFRDILKRNEGVRKQTQAQFDHILVDECQDLNSVQHEVISMMTDHVSDGSDGRSLWMVGDDKQSIYAFRGARPDLFVAFDGKEGWKTRMIRTNYRCDPEIVEMANRLIAHNDGQIPMEANPNPARNRGVGSIRVDTTEDEQDGALVVAGRIKRAIDTGDKPGKHAVLCRTNKEVHSYEAACLINGIPYVRRGATSFLESFDVKTMLGYVELVSGKDTEKMQDALGDIINNPRRFWKLTPERAKEHIEDVLREYAQKNNLSLADINPVEALQDSAFRDTLVSRLSGQRKGSFGFRKGLERISDLTDTLSGMQANSADPEYTTKDMFDEILMLKGMSIEKDPETGKTLFVEKTMREDLQSFMKDMDGGEDDEDEEEGSGEDEDEDDTGKGLGNISFLYELTKADPNDPEELEFDPNGPPGFLRKIDRLREKADDLRISVDDYDALDKEQKAKYSYLGTVHSVKGAQWDNVYVPMPGNKFPMQPWADPDDDPLTEEELQEQEEQERRLGYVAVTRAIHNLTILSPKRMGGKPVPPSQFIAEAGLVVGENVEPVPAEPAVEGEEAPVPPPLTREAALYAHLEVPYEEEDTGPQSWHPDDFKGES